jgi:MSHA pilin protein MshD
MWSRYTRSAGVTLVELIVALVIMGVALAGMVAVYASTTRASVDPVIVQQMQAIADNMMEEILLKRA